MDKYLDLEEKELELERIQQELQATEEENDILDKIMEYDIQQDEILAHNIEFGWPEDNQKERAEMKAVIEMRKQEMRAQRQARKEK